MFGGCTPQMAEEDLKHNEKIRSETKAYGNQMAKNGN